MITEDILEWLVGLLVGLLDVLPSIDIPQTPSFAVFQKANLIIPLDVLGVCFGLTAMVCAAGLLFWVIMKAINLIRGSGA